jgi:hypothetical protein
LKKRTKKLLILWAMAWPLKHLCPDKKKFSPTLRLLKIRKIS